jgi:hypothetical protein
VNVVGHNFNLMQLPSVFVLEDLCRTL